jgi:hypothetical protein
MLTAPKDQSRTGRFRSLVCKQARTNTQARTHTCTQSRTHACTHARAHIHIKYKHKNEVRSHATRCPISVHTLPTHSPHIPHACARNAQFFTANRCDQSGLELLARFRLRVLQVPITCCLRVRARACVRACVCPWACEIHHRWGEPPETLPRDRATIVMEFSQDSRE